MYTIIKIMDQNYSKYHSVSKTIGIHQFNSAQILEWEWNLKKTMNTRNWTGNYN